MYQFLTFLIVIACVMLVLVVLVQNPKGGGLGTAFGASSAQYFGVQRTTDFLEKATWTLAIVIFVISLGMNIFINRDDESETINTGPAPTTTAPPPVGDFSIPLGDNENNEGQ